MVAELELEIEAKEEENPLFYWGVAMVTAAKKSAQAKVSAELQA